MEPAMRWNEYTLRRVEALIVIVVLVLLLVGYAISKLR
jgi:hypothetical protein